jgi:hypothetical protein
MAGSSALKRLSGARSVLFQVRDTFLHFLADNLNGVEVHHVVKDPNDPSSDMLKMNCVNVTFLGVGLTNTINVQDVSVDVVADSAEDAVSWMLAVWGLLKAAFYTPLRDYTDYQNPVSCGSNLMWERQVNFRPVSVDNYSHYSAIIGLKFQ